MLAAYASASAQVRDGAQSSAAPIALEIALVKSEVEQGEPILLHYKFRTSDSTPSGVELGRRGSDWLDVTLIDSADHALPTVLDRCPPMPRSSYGGSQRVFAVHGRQPLNGQLAISQWVVPSSPGIYRIAIHAHVPYSELFSSDLPDKMPVLNVEQTLTLRVKAPVAQHLQQIAEQWKTRALDACVDTTERQQAIDALVTMPDTIALPAWRELMREPGYFERTYAAERLTHIATRAAAEALFDGLL